MIKAENLSYSFPHKELYTNDYHLLSRMKLHLPFVGTNGTGKSTLVNHDPSSG